MLEHELLPDKINKASRYVITDPKTGEFYRDNKGPNGWYSKTIGDARTYTNYGGAKATIRRGGHHVIYPDRSPRVGVVQMHYLGTVG